MERNHPPLTTFVDPTEKPSEIKHQQASSLEQRHISSKKIRSNMQIRNRVNENDLLEKAQVTNRAGKTTGKNYSWWNVTNQDGSK